MPRGRVGVLILLATIVWSTSGCSVEVRPADESDAAAAGEFTPLLLTFLERNSELQPGQVECNKGGEAQACGDSSLEIAELVDSYGAQLAEVIQDAPDRAAAEDFVEALGLYSEGLRERTQGLATQDNDLFVSGNDKIETAGEAWLAAEGVLVEGEG